MIMYALIVKHTTLPSNLIFHGTNHPQLKWYTRVPHMAGVVLKLYRHGYLK